MTNKKITIVTDPYDSWIGIYLDNKLAMEDSDLGFIDVLKLLRIEFELREVEEIHGSLPDKLSELK